MVRGHALLATLLCGCAAADPSGSFLPPQVNASASGGELAPATLVTSADECALACLADPQCVSFNVGPPIPAKSCGHVHECWNASTCPSVLSLSCPGGVFTAVEFASYGNPTAVAGKTCAFVQGACNAPTSVAVVTAACVGKSSCSIPATTGEFGGQDPCTGVPKRLAVSLAGAGCSSAPPPAGTLQCQTNGHSRIYTVAPSAPGTAYYQRLQPRNDSRFVQAVPYLLDVPTSGVSLNGGVLGVAFDTGIEYLLQYSVDGLLFKFRERAGLPQPNGAQCIGWDCRIDWVEGSLAALFLMGAGGHLRWVEHPQLRSMMDAVIDGIEECAEADGYLAAFTQEKLATDEHPDYTTSWTVHGFLEAAIAGNTKALQMIRRHMNVFNNHSLIPTFLPPDGGNWPYATPLGPFPPGINNKTSYTGKTLTGHTIYLIVQGLIHNTRMALSPVGTQADVDLLQKLYIEPWWLQGLIARDLTVISHKLYDAHNYQLTGIEAYADLYILTGNQTYLDAVLAAWAMHRDPLQGWIHVGGSLAINEAGVYEPGSYWLSADSASAYKHRDTLREERGIAAGEHGAHVSHAGHSHDRALQKDWGHHPTGEFCGAVFWLKLNQRLHRLQPDNETFVLEIEREVYNEGLGHQGKGGVGIRYFSNLNGVKEGPSHIGTCCEGQGTRLYGSLNEYLYSTVAGGAGIYVDIYAPSSIVHGALNVTVATQWPYGDAVTITVSSSTPGATAIDLALRMPSWVMAPAVPVALNSASGAYSGIPGSYLHISRAWGSADVLSFTLPMSLAAHRYTGVTQLPPYSRWAYTYGPVLLAATGPWDKTLDALLISGVADPSTPAAFFTPTAGAPLHWTIGSGSSQVLVQPAWEIEDNELFSAYPAFA